MIIPNNDQYSHMIITSWSPWESPRYEGPLSSPSWSTMGNGLPMHPSNTWSTYVTFSPRPQSLRSAHVQICTERWVPQQFEVWLLASTCWKWAPGALFFWIPPLRLIQHEPEPKYGWLGHWNSLVCTTIFSTNESGSRGFHVGSLFLTIPHLGGKSLETVKASTSEPIGVLKLNRTRLSATKQLCFDYPSKLQLAYPSSYSCTNLYRSCHITGGSGIARAPNIAMDQKISKACYE